MMPPMSPKKNDAKKKKDTGRDQKLVKSWMNEKKFQGGLKEATGDPYSAFCRACSVQVLARRIVIIKYSEGIGHTKNVTVVRKDKHVAQRVKAVLYFFFNLLQIGNVTKTSKGLMYLEEQADMLAIVEVCPKFSNTKLTESCISISGYELFFKFLGP
ncbi:hypothetical protein QYM36_004653 [Artemia franciscana]|uniref:Uncharacterized protein n=1 Tax=Artemia franciscana TaxID=6661 RepID=A0AA88I451_ARTSF|nr:hypothetical protein QYM36_004653 [Artemia franciscana]